MHPNRMLYHAVDLLFCQMEKENVLKSLMASYLKSLDPSLTGIKEVGSNKRQYQFNFESNFKSKREVFIPPHDLQSRKSCCCLDNPDLVISDLR